MKIGDYVRTKRRGFQPPQIAKIKSMKKDSGYKNQYYIELDHNLLPDYNFYIYEEDIIKLSPNIIDLIEVGDYVNGNKIQEKINEDIIIGNEEGIWSIYPEEIEIIVTKEQFESMEYKVGE